MMRRVVAFFSSQIAGLHQAAYILAAFALLSALLGFLRDRLLAHTFGAGIELDVYYAAFRIPDIIFVALAALVSAYALIPALSKREGKAQHSYIDTVVIGFSLMGVLVSGLAFFFAPQLLSTLFPTLSEGAIGGDLLMLTRILLLQPILLGFSNILAAITQVQRRYVLYASTSLVYNLGIIIGIVFLYPHMGLGGLAWGVVLGALLHMGIQIPNVLKDGFLRRTPRAFETSAFLETVTSSLPRALALSVNQIVIFVLVIIAGTMATGSIAVFTLAFNLQSVPLAIIGASYSVAAFPTLAAAFSRGDTENFLRQVSAASRHILFWSLPAIALIIILRAHIVRTVLGTGAFDWTDTRLTAAALALFSISLAAHALMLLLVRAYYAAGRSWIPLWVNAVAALLTVGLGLILAASAPGIGGRMFVEALLRVVDVPGAEMLLLPFAYTVGVVVGAAMFLLAFEIHFGGFLKRINTVVWESVTAAGFAGGAAYAVLTLFGGIQEATTFISVLLHGSVAGIAGLIVAALWYWFVGSREFFEILSSLKRKWQAEPISSGETEL